MAASMARDTCRISRGSLFSASASLLSFYACDLEAASARIPCDDQAQPEWLLQGDRSIVCVYTRVTSIVLQI